MCVPDFQYITKVANDKGVKNTFHDCFRAPKGRNWNLSIMLPHIYITLENSKVCTEEGGKH